MTARSPVVPLHQVASKNIFFLSRNENPKTSSLLQRNISNHLQILASHVPEWLSPQLMLLFPAIGNLCYLNCAAFGIEKKQHFCQQNSMNGKRKNNQKKKSYCPHHPTSSLKGYLLVCLRSCPPICPLELESRSMGSNSPLPLANGLLLFFSLTIVQSSKPRSRCAYF